MVSQNLDREHDEKECPCCRMRAAFTRALLDPGNELSRELLDDLLDTVESIRAFDAAYGADAPAAAAMAAADAVRLIHVITEAAEASSAYGQG